MSLRRAAKHVRQIRVGRSCLGNYLTNLQQALELLQLQSDLYLNSFTKKVKKISAKALFPDDAEGPGGLRFLADVLIDKENVDSGERELEAVEPQGE